MAVSSPSRGWGRARAGRGVLEQEGTLIIFRRTHQLVLKGRGEGMFPKIQT